MNSPSADSAPLSQPDANASPNPALPQAASMTGDASFSMLAKMLYLVTRLAIPPMILAHVSLNSYGLWSACFILVGYIGLADLGFSSVYVRSAARLHAQRDTAGIGALLSTGICCMLGISLLLLLLISWSLPQLMQGLQIEPANQASAKILILGVVVVFLFDMSLNAFAYVLHGLQRFRSEQKVWMLAFLLEMAMIALFLLNGFGIYALLIAFAIRYVFSISCNIRQVYLALPGLRVGPRQFDRSLLPHFMRFGLSIQASSFFSMALHSGDRLIAGFFLGPAAIALFDLGGKLPVSAMSIPAAITQITMPAAARLSLNQASTECSPAMRDLYASTTRSVCLVSALPMAFLSVFSLPLCLTWLGSHPDLNTVPALMSLAALGAFLHITTGPGTSVFRGMGLTANEFIYHGLRLACIAIALGLAWLYGGLHILSIAVALAAASGVAAILYLAHNHRKLGLPLRHLFRKILLPGVTAFASALLLHALWQLVLPPELGRWQTLALLGAFGILHSLLSASAAWLLFDADEKRHLTSFAGRLRPHFLRQRSA
jgi:O-antigen/teichoic acid export membrane protein